MSREILLELFYWPPVSWLALARCADILWIEANEHYQKGSYRHRCYIAGPNGILRLSVPLRKGKHRQMPIRDVRIAYDTPWQRIQWRTLRSAYGSAPFFEYYADAVRTFFEKRYVFLFDLNFEILLFLWQALGGRAEIRLTEHYMTTLEAQLRGITDARGCIHRKKQPAVPLISYPQVFEDRFGFLSDLSVLDLLFCYGPYMLRN
ncbi:MAG: WbqC family protein [Saprospiraceae bacterium]|nr:WbqC family protein [Saprospiraceae bacterium]MDW8482944.1 WbqC family protein [Saprospiraceae bacterium]